MAATDAGIVNGIDSNHDDSGETRSRDNNAEVERISQASVKAKTWQAKFSVLKTLIDVGEVTDRDIVDTLFNLLVAGDFDLETNFVINGLPSVQDDHRIILMLDVMKACNIRCQAEIWSKFKGICRKSFRNLQACIEVGLVERLLTILADADEVISELLVDMLGILTCYNISVKELKQLLSMLKAEGSKWPAHAVKLLGVLQTTPEKHGPDCFFNFPGQPNAAIALPPLKVWPYANGFTFTTWFRMDPLNSLRVDVDKPYLYCFRNSKGLGYSGHFVGGCFIITVLKSKGKGFQHCVKFEFKPRKWYMITVVHVYNRWRVSELKCYANGQLASFCEMNWCVGGSDHFDKCFLGSAETGDDSRVFCGQMAATYVFSETLNASQIYALYQLGPGYKNQFKFATESDHLLANHHRKVLYEDGKLADSLVFAYNAKSTDGQLCLECSPKSHTRDGGGENQRWFVHSPHALMLPGVQAVVTHSIHSALHSVGGCEVLFPLFAQLDHRQPDGTLDTTVCSTLLRFLFQLLQGSVKTQLQVLHGKGFLVIGSLLEKASKAHITEDVLETIIAIAKFLDQSANGVPLMRQFCDHILFNPALWIHTTPTVQVSLYTFLATELIQSPAIQTTVRRISTVLLLVHALKYYYWVTNPQPRSGIVPKGLDGPRPDKNEILSLRAFILLYLKQIVTRASQISDDELQAILGYLLTIHEDDNLLDVVQLLVAMMSEHGALVSPVFDARNGVAVVFKLLGSGSQLVRVQALKLLAYFLKNSTEKRKHEVMEGQSLFMLIGERLLLHGRDAIDVTTYNALYEVLVEKPCTQVLRNTHADPTLTTVIHNPAMMKVIATVLRQSEAEHDTMEVKLLFLADLLKLFQASHENRRILLQQSVWQDWLLAIGYLRPRSGAQRKCQELIFHLFQVLLYHAIKLEWGGWRVWVDTLAIVHSKVSYEEHKIHMEKMYADYKLSQERSQQSGAVSAITGMTSSSSGGAVDKPAIEAESDQDTGNLKVEVQIVGDDSAASPQVSADSTGEDATGASDDLPTSRTDSNKEANEESSPDASATSAGDSVEQSNNEAIDPDTLPNEIPTDSTAAPKEESSESPATVASQQVDDVADTEVVAAEAESSHPSEDARADEISDLSKEQAASSSTDDVEGQDTGHDSGAGDATPVSETAADTSAADSQDAEASTAGDEPASDDNAVPVSAESADAEVAAAKPTDVETAPAESADGEVSPADGGDGETGPVENETAENFDGEAVSAENEANPRAGSGDGDKADENAPGVVADRAAIDGNGDGANDAKPRAVAESADDVTEGDKDPNNQESSVSATAAVDGDVSHTELANIGSDAIPSAVARDSAEPDAVADASAEPAALADASAESSAVEDASAKPAAVEDASAKPAAVADASVEPAAVADASVEPAAMADASAEPSAVADASKDGKADGVRAESLKSLDVTPLKELKKQEEDLDEDEATNREAQKLPANGTSQQQAPHQQQFSPGPRTVLFRIPEFKWSDVHLRILDDLFSCLENDLTAWKSNSTESLVDVVNSSSNVIFVHNTVHLVSQMVDNVILACGGILPILSSATSPNYELDSIDSSQGMTMESAWEVLNRLAVFADLLAHASSISLAEIENEKNIANGAVLRQCLRIACMCAVRNCLETRYIRNVQPSAVSRRSTSSHGGDVVASGAERTAAENGGGEDEGEVVSASDAARFLTSLMCNSATPIVDHVVLLQDTDIGRLRAIIYREMDDTKQAQFLGIAVVYFVSVLMVSKYRDILDPISHDKLRNAPVARKLLASATRKSGEVGAQLPSTAKNSIANSDSDDDDDDDNDDDEDDDFNDVAGDTTVGLPNGRTRESTKKSSPKHAANVKDILRNLAKSTEPDQDSPASTERFQPSAFPTQQVTSIQSTYRSFDRSVVVKSKPTAADSDAVTDATSAAQAETSVSSKSDLSCVDDAEQVNEAVDHRDLPAQADIPAETVSETDVSGKLERSMDQIAPLLRDIFVDFSSYLSKTLIGSHGQDLLVEGLACMKSYSSVVELVMLLCSQEWQNSIQKNAGLAFIELINEGRILCHAMKDHVVRVANEADFILNKQRAEDVKQHAQFESANAVYIARQREEERQCEALIAAAKHRDHAQARALKNRITNILTNKLGAWGADFDSEAEEYWRLDTWEDDTRRRRRFVRNPYGSSHPKATLMKTAELHVVQDAADTDSNQPRSPALYNPQGAEAVDVDSDDVIIATDDVDQDELQGPVSFSTEADLIVPGLCLHGLFSITTDEFFFEVNEHHESYVRADSKVLQYADGVHGKWLFQEVRAVFSRRYLLQATAVEIFFANRTSVMVNYPDAEVMKKVINYLPRVGIGTGYGLPQERRISLATPRQLFKSSNMCERWKKRDISNFEYLMFLNTIAGRTMNDLNQYPIFPWVISNYEAEELDLSLASNYRNLAKPVGALNPKRADYFKQRYESWDDPTIPKFHYGTHYSNAAFTLSWLVRVEPFTTLFLSLQGGKFDHADRTFHSIHQSWKNCQRDSHDVKELIPEFFYLPEMLVNNNKYQLGRTSDGVRVDDVRLPPWAKTADDFVRLNRMALESEIVSCQLNQWIDLIFGFKQRGPAAESAVNVFYYVTYENSVNLKAIKDPIERAGIREQIKSFGQTPSQLMLEPHPPKSSAMHLTPMMFKETNAHDVIMVLKFHSNSPVVHVAANTHPSLHAAAVVTCTKNLQFCLNKWNQVPSDGGSASTPGDNNKQQLLPIEADPLMTAHGMASKRQINDMLDQSVLVDSSCFAVTADNRFLVICGYWDRSFRVVSVGTANLHQAIFGHWDVVTCVARSETYIAGDCYLVTGSRDATLMLWYWSGRRSRVIGDSANPDENPSARAVLTGHNTEICCCAVCAELGLIASGSLEGPILLHTITGDLLRSLQPHATDVQDDRLLPQLLLFSGEGMIIVSYNDGLICCFTMNGRLNASRSIDDNVKAMLCSNNSQYLVTGGEKGAVQVWNAWDLTHLYTYPQCDASIHSLAISHDQRTVISGMTSGSIVAFHINFNKWHYEYQHDNTMLS